MATRIETAVPHLLPLERSRGSTVWRFVRKKPLGAAGGVLTLVKLVVTALFADVLATHDPTRTSMSVLVAPGHDFWLGTDNLGRDLCSRVIYGSRISLVVGVGATLLGAVVGGLIGLLSGYVGGKTDLLIQRVMDITCRGAADSRTGPGAVRGTGSVGAQRVPRDLDPDHAARGARHPRERALHPRVPIRGGRARARPHPSAHRVPPHPAQHDGALHRAGSPRSPAGSILVEAALSFLGLGIPEPYPSWGRMLSIAAAEYAQKAPWLVMFPGLAISLAVFGTNLLGDALRDTLDPRLRGS